MKNITYFFLCFSFLLPAKSVKSIEVTITAQTNASCFGTSNGSATALAYGGTGPYTYSWSGPYGYYSGSATALNMYAGVYTVTATDSFDLSTATANVTITQPSEININVNDLQHVCGQYCNGVIFVSAIGGVPPYIYEWSNGMTGQVISNLCSGLYTVKVTDLNGCFKLKFDVIKSKPEVEITGFITVLPDCHSCNGEATINFAGGTAPYSFEWPDGSDLQTVTGLCEGNYTVSITDSYGCFDTATVDMGNLSGFDIIIDTLINVNCANGSLGMVSVHATGGTGVYSYLWMPGNINDSAATNLTEGYYTVYITESGGCSDSMQVYIGNSANIYASVVNSPANCADNGSSQVYVGGVNPPFSFLWSDSLNQTTQTATNLAPGLYYVTITDTVGCNLSVSAYIQYQCFNLIKGTVYLDNNQNCVHDSGEYGIPNVCVKALPGNEYSYTGSNGEYTLYAVSPNNTVFPTGLNIYGAVSTCPSPSVLNVNFTGQGDTATGNNFGFYVDSNAFDLKVFQSWTPANPGFTKTYHLFGFNNSPYARNAVIRLTYDSLLQYTSSTSGGVQDPLLHTVEWVAANILPYSYWNYGQIIADFYVPLTVSIQDTLCSLFEILPIAGDMYPTDNIRLFCQSVTGSYDPNSKEVYPVGHGLQGFVTPEDSILYYTIHFQNTGNDTAFTVVIIDTLSPYLNPASFVPGGASHPYTYTFTGQGIITFRFDNILLPDSNVNENLSKGFISYTVNLLPELLPWTVIKNSANIIFDFNETIVTNTTVNTIASPLAINKGNNKLNIRVYPNPFINCTNFEISGFNSADLFAIKIYNVLGGLVKSYEKITQRHINICLNEYESGLYIYKVFKNNGFEASGKIILK